MQRASWNTVCRRSTQFAAYNRMSCPKEHAPLPDYGHEGLPWINDHAFSFLQGSEQTSQKGPQVRAQRLPHRGVVKEQNESAGRASNLIASENVTSRRTRGVMGSDFAHRLRRGPPRRALLQGTEIIDEIEAC